MNTASATGKSSEAEPSRLRAQVDEALRDHGAILRGLFESAPDAILIMARDGSIARINAQAETMFGYGQGELVGKPLEVLLPRRFRQVHAEHRAAYFSAPSARPMGTGLELYGLRKDGREFSVDITLNPLETDSGIVVLSFIRDITGRERAEEALRKSEGRLRALFEHYPDAVLLVDPVNFTIIDCNQAACHMNGYSREELVGQPANMLNEVQVGEEVKAAYVEYLRQEGSLKYEIYHRRKDGTVFPVEVSATCFTLSGQELLLGIDRDITQRKQMEEAEREQRALAEALRDTTAALNSTLHFDEVLDRILTNVGHVVPHDSADIMLLESGIARVVRSRGYVERGLETSVLAVRLTVEDVPTLRQMAETGQPLTVPDTQAFPDWVDIPQTRWVRSYAGAPIHVKGQTLGFLNLASAMPGFFTPAHAERLQAFADQAAVAIENARLFQAAQRRLGEQTALLAASTAITSSLDFATVLNRLAQQMGQAINATSVYICDWNPLTGTSTVLAEYYSPEAAPEESVSDLGITYSVSRDLDENLIEQLLAGKVLVVHADDPDLSEPTRAHMVRYAGRSRILVPLIVKEIVIGHVELWESRRRRDFTNQESALCQGIARQAAIALENTRLFEAEHLRRQEIETVLQASLSLTASLDLPQVFDAILSAVLRLVPAYETHIFLFSEGRLTFGAAMTSEGRLTKPLSEPRSDGVTYTVARSGEPLVVEDVRRHPLFIHVFGDFEGAIIGLPLKIRSTVVGVMNVAYSDPHRFSESEQRVLSLLAAQAAVAIQNARLHEQVQRHADELDRRVAERTAELERERRRSQAILDAADEGMVFTDRDGTIEYVNPAIERITGYTAVEALGRTPRLWQSDLTPPAVYDDMKRTLNLGEVWRGEVINRRKDGALYDAHLTVTPLKGVRGEAGGQVVVQRDISRQKELDRLRDQFVSNVSHELRTPLANVKLYVNLLDRGRPDKREQYMQTLYRETARLQKLIEDLLDLSRLDLGTAAIHVVPTDLNRMAADLIADRSAMAAVRNLSLDYEPAPDLSPGLADPAMIAQVMSNLMTNAINYTPQGGAVTLTTVVRRHHDQPWVTFSVHNTGPGISVKDVPHLFERFYRGEAGRASGAPGTGLGLAICKEIVDKLDGRITVDSQPGQGVTFTIWLRPADRSPQA